MQSPGPLLRQLQPEPGWTRTTTTENSTRRWRSSAREQTERIATVTWEGGTIAPGEFNEFGLSTKVPNAPGRARSRSRRCRRTRTTRSCAGSAQRTADTPASRVTLGGPKEAEETAAPGDRDDRRRARPRTTTPTRRRSRSASGSPASCRCGGARARLPLEAAPSMSPRRLAAVLLAALVACPAAAGHGDGATRGYTSRSPRSSPRSPAFPSRCSTATTSSGCGTTPGGRS